MYLTTPRLEFLHLIVPKCVLGMLTKNKECAVKSSEWTSTGNRIVKSFLVGTEHDFALNFIAGNTIPVRGLTRSTRAPSHAERNGSSF